MCTIVSVTDRRALVVYQSGEDRCASLSAGACHFNELQKTLRQHVPRICFKLTSSYNASIIGWLVGSWLPLIVLNG
jgi:hypothetical protein